MRYFSGRASRVARGGIALIFGMLWFAAARAEDASEFVAIVNFKNPVSTMSVSDLRDLFLVNQQKWPGGARVMPILPPSGSPALNKLLSKVFLMTGEDELSMYYMAAIFQQKITEVPRSGVPAAAIEVTAANEGAVAFVPRSALQGRRSLFKVIEVKGL